MSKFWKLCYIPLTRDFSYRTLRAFGLIDIKLFSGSCLNSNSLIKTWGWTHHFYIREMISKYIERTWMCQVTHLISWPTVDQFEPLSHWRSSVIYIMAILCYVLVYTFKMYKFVCAIFSEIHNTISLRH